MAGRASPRTHSSPGEPHTCARPQGIGGPTCATVLTKWFAAGERGTYWGMWNIAHNLGGFAAPVIVRGGAAAACCAAAPCALTALGQAGGPGGRELR